MRDIDDKIIYELNNTIPTKYFAKELNITDQCKSFYEQVSDRHIQEVKHIVGHVCSRCGILITGIIIRITLLNYIHLVYS